MTGPSLRQKLRSELETAPETRRFGSGWFAGTIGFLLAVGCLFLSVCRAFPGIFVTPQLSLAFAQAWFSSALIAAMAVAFGLALVNLALRPNRILGLAAMAVTLLAGLIAQLNPVETSGAGLYFGLDFFVLNVVLTGLLFVPLERLSPLKREQRLFRTEWREDLFYYFVSSLMVQVLTFLAMAPSNAVMATTAWASFRAMVFALPMVVQVALIMVFTDFVQYWLHRAFHRVPALWRFHAVHHSTTHLDWVSGLRTHPADGALLAPPFVLLIAAGFDPAFPGVLAVVQIVTGLFLHANVRWRWRLLHRIVITPEFHHWHHADEPAARDTNYSTFLPLWDLVFGTYRMPRHRRPQRYGIAEPMPSGLVHQLRYPLRDLPPVRRVVRQGLRHPVRSARRLSVSVRRGARQLWASARRPTRAFVHSDV